MTRNCACILWILRDKSCYTTSIWEISGKDRGAQWMRAGWFLDCLIWRRGCGDKSMSWNYRVVREKQSTGDYWYGVYTIYYDENGKPNGQSRPYAAVVGETMDEIRDCFAK